MYLLFRLSLYLLPLLGWVFYLYTQKDAIIENVKSKVMKSVMPSIGGGITNAIPDSTGPAIPDFGGVGLPKP